MTRWDLAAGSVAPLWLLGYMGAMLYTRSQLARAAAASEKEREARYHRRGKGLARAALAGMVLTFACFGSAYALRLLPLLSSVSCVLVYYAAAQTLSIIRKCLGAPLGRSTTASEELARWFPPILGAIARAVSLLLLMAAGWSVLWLVSSETRHPVDPSLAVGFGLYWLTVLLVLLPALCLADCVFPCPSAPAPEARMPLPSSECPP